MKTRNNDDKQSQNQGSRKPLKKNFKKGGQKPHSKKPRTMDELDRELENYHMKGGNKEVGKYLRKLIVSSNQTT